MRSVLSGRRESFAPLYVRYCVPIYRLAYGMTANREAAEDLTQEVFMRAFQKLDKFNFQSSFGTWFYRLALNHCLNRRQRRITWNPATIEGGQFKPDVSPIASLERDILREQVVGQIHRALLTLKPKLRLIVILKDIEELSYDEIAERLDLSSGTVASCLHRARRLLARKLEHLKGSV